MEFEDCTLKAWSINVLYYCLLLASNKAEGLTQKISCFVNHKGAL